MLTNDVETTSIWFNTLRDETGRKVLEEGLPLLLDLYERYDIKSTFFITGNIAEKFPRIVKLINQQDHEIGSHGLYHDAENGFDRLNISEQIEQLSRSKGILSSISGKEIISFRSPALRTNSYTVPALLKTGFLIDSSVAPQRFDMFLSSGISNKLKWLNAPRKPYRTSENNITIRGQTGIIEIPLNALVLPYIGTTMRIFPNLTRSVRSLLNIENYFSDKPIVFLIHPNEIIDESESEHKRVISRRSSNFLSYLLQDYIRGKLKVKNLGERALKLYEQQIIYFKNKGYKFISLQEYARRQGLLKQPRN